MLNLIKRILFRLGFWRPKIGPFWPDGAIECLLYKPEQVGTEYRMLCFLMEDGSTAIPSPNGLIPWTPDATWGLEERIVRAETQAHRSY